MPWELLNRCLSKNHFNQDNEKKSVLKLETDFFLEGLDGLKFRSEPESDSNVGTTDSCPGAGYLDVGSTGSDCALDIKGFHLNSIEAILQRSDFLC